MIFYWVVWTIALSAAVVGIIAIIGTWRGSLDPVGDLADKKQAKPPTPAAR